MIPPLLIQNFVENAIKYGLVVGSEIEISAKVGYSNYSYFTRLFKKYYGKTPREYRQECQRKGLKGI